MRRHSPIKLIGKKGAPLFLMVLFDLKTKGPALLAIQVLS